MKLRFAPISLAFVLVAGLASAQSTMGSVPTSGGFKAGPLGGSTQAPVPNPGPLAEYAPEAPPPTRPDSSARIAAYFTGGLGIAGVGTGIVFGVAAISHKIRADKQCDDNNVCSHEGLELQHAGQKDGQFATAFFVGGAALLGTSVLLFLAPPRGVSGDEHAASVRLQIAPGSASLVGSF